MPRILDGGAPFSPLTTGEPTQNPQQPTKTPSNQPATNMASTPIGIPTNTTDDETLLRVTRSGALFGAPPVLEPEEESSPIIPPQVERASSAPSEFAQVYVSDVTPDEVSPSDHDNPDTPHGNGGRPAPVEDPRPPEVVEPGPQEETLI